MLHPGLQVLQPWLAELGDSLSLPGLEQLNEWRRTGMPTFATVDCAGLPYELHIAKYQQIPTRPDNWHDAFNALCWLAWPQTKLALHRAHLAILQAGGEAERRQRSPARDALSLLDEGGAVMLCSRPEMFDLLRKGEWQTLFIEQREQIERHARLLVLGHASLDALRDPRLGITSKCLLFVVEQAELERPAIELRVLADTLAAARLADPTTLGRGRDYPPLPILGWPGWHPDNADPSFYRDHPGCFRPRNPQALAASL